MELFNVDNVNHTVESGSDKNFGLTIAAVLFIVTLHHYRLQGLDPQSASTLLTSTLLICISFYRPNLLSLLNQQWQKLGYLLSQIMNPVILGLVYFLVLTPIALTKRCSQWLFNKNTQPSSRWQQRNPTTARCDFKQQF